MKIIDSCLFEVSKSDIHSGILIVPDGVKTIVSNALKDIVVKKIVLPNSLVKIEDEAFSNLYTLEEIDLPDSISSLGKRLFLNCKKLKRVKLPNSICELPDEFFKGCEKLNIELPKTITKLGDEVFFGCRNLTHFPDRVISFGKGCFKNCSSLLEANLNREISFIPDALFSGCLNLENITYAGQDKLAIGHSSFKNCKSLKDIPSFIANYNKYAFAGCDGLKEITIVDPHIPEGCFCNCKGLKKINNMETISKLESLSFSGCLSLKELNLPLLKEIPASAFAFCSNLKSVKLGTELNHIHKRVFYCCSSLSEFLLPDSVEYIDKEAMRYCKSLTFLHIPSNLQKLGFAALANMNSLEYIDSKDNLEFITTDNKLLIMPRTERLVLYAAGSKDKSYTLKNYNVYYEKIDREVIRPLSYISEFAFAGSHNLEELTICGCTNAIEISAFADCPNLKKLVIEGISFGACPSFSIREDGMYMSCQERKYKHDLPFESIYFSGEISSIYPNGFRDFKNIKNIYFSEDKEYYIGASAFYALEHVEDVYIPDNITAIQEAAFNPNTTLHFSNGLALKNLVSMSTYTNTNGEYYRAFILSDMFYIEDDKTITSFPISEIDKDFKFPDLIKYSSKDGRKSNKIAVFVFYDYLKYLKKFGLDDEILKNGILIKNLSLENAITFFEYLKKNHDLTINILKQSEILENNEECSIYLLKNISEFIAKIKIIKKHKITNPLFLNKLLLAACSNEDYEELMTYDPNLLAELLRSSHLLHITKDDGHLSIPNCNDNSFAVNNTYLVNHKIIGKKLLHFLHLIKENNIRDKYLFKEYFIGSDNPLCEELMLHFNSNLKRAIKTSKVFAGPVIKTNAQNFYDLLILLKIAGAFSDDLIFQQKATTFITEKILTDKLPEGQKNPYVINGDDIHRIFNFKDVEIEYNEEFANFFLENYRSLYDLEISHSGIIERIYKNFKSISRTSTSDKGSQRHLKVTLEKCIQYLSDNKFDGVTPENRTFATLIGYWYDENQVWQDAQTVYEESLNAPRNIFAPYEVSDEGLKIFDNSTQHDLKEVSERDFQYEWLPKQDYDNLILGKYCSCCAHIKGGGQGIMRASMILDCCQNLIIRYHREIIAKATIYVNREAGYAVFNNLEESLNFNSPEYNKEIYEAFMRASRAFLEAYNKNNPTCPLTKITIGTGRNKILNYLDEKNHPSTKIEKALDWGNYSLNKSLFHYTGDWNSGQKLVLKG